MEVPEIQRNCCDCEAKSPLFCHLTPDEFNQVKQNRITIHFQKGETIRKQGTHLTHVISLNKGLAKVYLEGLNHHNSILRIVKPTNFIGGPGLYFDQMHHYSITALTEATVCLIDVNLFKSLIDNNRKFAHAFLADLSDNMLSVYNRLINLTQKQMPGRMAVTLLYLTDEVFESDKFMLCISKQDLADFSGMSKESAIKVLREFQKEELIRITDTEMHVVNKTRLIQISKTG